MRRITSLSHLIAATLLCFLASVQQSKVGRNVAARWQSWQPARPARKVFGQGLVEYALLLMLIAMVVVGAVSTVGTKVSQSFEEVHCKLDGGEYHTDNSESGKSEKCKSNGGGGGGGKGKK